MNSIYINYVADYIEKRTRPSAFHRLMTDVQNNFEILSEQDAMELIQKANNFSASYKKAWPWKRKQVVARAIRVNIKKS